METEQKITVRQIHNEFMKDIFDSQITDNQKKLLNSIGYMGVPPEYLTNLFPCNKLIHINRILKVCEKYNLFFTDLENFIDTIPKRNVDMVETFCNNYPYYHSRGSEKRFIKGRKEAEKHKDSMGNNPQSVLSWKVIANKEMIYSESYNQKDLTTYPDPVIIAMIHESWNDMCLKKPQWGAIVTAWGAEENLSELTNEKNN